MAMLRTVVGAAVALLVVMAMVLEAQAVVCPSPASYLACQNEVTKKGVTPSQACCNKLATVLADKINGAFCLCEAMTSKTAQDFHVDKEAALALPKECQQLMGLQYVHGYNCGGSIVN